MSWVHVRLTVAFAAALALSLAPQAAEAQHRGGGRGRGAARVGVSYGLYAPYGFYGPSWGLGWYGPWAFGYGFDPFFTAAYRPEGGIDPNVAMLAGFGAIDLNVKPGAAEVWVDGKFAAEARDLDGYPTFLWLAEGPHRVEIRQGGYATFSEQVEIQRGVVKELKVRLSRSTAEAVVP